MNKQDVLAPTFRLLKQQLEKLKTILKLEIKYFVGDGKYGNNTCLSICKEFGLCLIPKLQNNSSLYFENVVKEK